MTREIVVPLNGSARDAEALIAARSLARHLDASLLLVHIEPIMPSLIDIAAHDRQLEHYVASLAAEGFDVHYLVDFGRPDSGIVRIRWAATGDGRTDATASWTPGRAQARERNKEPAHILPGAIVHSARGDGGKSDR